MRGTGNKQGIAYKRDVVGSILSDGLQSPVTWSLAEASGAVTITFTPDPQADQTDIRYDIDGGSNVFINAATSPDTSITLAVGEVVTVALRSRKEGIIGEFGAAKQETGTV